MADQINERDHATYVSPEWLSLSKEERDSYTEMCEQAKARTEEDRRQAHIEMLLWAGWTDEMIKGIGL